MNIYLGKHKSGEDFYLDFEKEGIHFVLLFGSTGSGKSVFHTNLYKQLVSNSTPDQLKLAIMDAAQVGCFLWGDSPYLYKPIPTNTESAIELLEELAGVSASRALGKSDNHQRVFLHIEECDLFRDYFERTIAALAKVLEHTDKNNMFVIYSTSRSPSGYLPNWLLERIDLKVVFLTVTAGDARELLGNPAPSRFKLPGERILAFNNKQVYCQPFTESEVKELRENEGNWLSTDD